MNSTAREMEEMRRRILFDIPEDYDKLAIMHCPICGEESKLTEMLRQYYARCTACGTSGPLRATPQDAKNAWETRV